MDSVLVHNSHERSSISVTSYGARKMYLRSMERLSIGHQGQETAIKLKKNHLKKNEVKLTKN